MQIFNIHETKTHFSKLIALVEKGNEVVIGRAGKPVAKLVSIKVQQKKRKPGLLKGKIWVSPDFDDEDPQINELFYGKE